MEFFWVEVAKPIWNLQHKSRGKEEEFDAFFQQYNATEYKGKKPNGVN